MTLSVALPVQCSIILVTQISFRYFFCGFLSVFRQILYTPFHVLQPLLRNLPRRGISLTPLPESNPRQLSDANTRQEEVDCGQAVQIISAERSTSTWALLA